MLEVSCLVGAHKSNRRVVYGLDFLFRCRLYGSNGCSERGDGSGCGCVHCCRNGHFLIVRVAMWPGCRRSCRRFRFDSFPSIGHVGVTHRLVDRLGIFLCLRLEYQTIEILSLLLYFVEKYCKTMNSEKIHS